MTQFASNDEFAARLGITLTTDEDARATTGPFDGAEVVLVEVADLGGVAVPDPAQLNHAEPPDRRPPGQAPARRPLASSRAWDAC